MSVRIRLQRHGKKDNAFYHIVVADARAPRDGKRIERIGSYNPNTNPATISIDLDKGVKWLRNGAQPTDSVRAILSYKGVLYKKHLLGGVDKGAFSIEQAETKFAEWLAVKENRIQTKKDHLSGKSAEANKTRHLQESKVKEEKAKAIAEKNALTISASAEPPEHSEQAPSAEVDPSSNTEQENNSQIEE